MSKCRLCEMEISTLPPWAPKSTADTCGFCLSSLQAAERFISTRGAVRCSEEDIEREAARDLGMGELEYDDLDDGGFSTILPLINKRRQLVYGRNRHTRRSA